MLFKVLHVLKLTDIYKLYLGKFIITQLHSTSTTPVKLLISNVLNHNVHQYETRNQQGLHIACIEYARTNTLVQDSYLVRGPQSWNPLPPHLTECLTKYSFVNRLRHALLASYWIEFRFFCTWIQWPERIKEKFTLFFFCKVLLTCCKLCIYYRVCSPSTTAKITTDCCFGISNDLSKFFSPYLFFVVYLLLSFCLLQAYSILIFKFLL